MIPVMEFFAVAAWLGFAAALTITHLAERKQR